MPEAHIRAQTGSDALIEQSRIALESELSQSIFENYGIKPADISIQFSINHNQDETQVSVSALQLLFPWGTPQNKASAAASYAKNMLGCQATVQISDN